MLGVSAMSVYLEPERTCFENIRRIPAASFMSVRSDRKSTVEYWRPEPGKRLYLRSDAECREVFQEIFSKAVKGCMRSAFPVSSMLSGGLDSSAIVGTASKQLARENRQLLTLSSVPTPEWTGRVADEREYIGLFEDWDSLEMHHVSAPGSGPFDDLDRLVETASLCSYSYQHFLYTAFVRTAKENHARVILDGDGGELSASCHPSGYLAELLLAGKLTRLGKELRHIDANQRIHWPAIKGNVLRPLIPYSLQKLVGRHRRFRDLIEYPIRKEFVQDVLGRDTEMIRESINQMLAERPDHRKNMAWNLLLERCDLRQRSHAGYVDYHKARFAYPFLDKRVLEFSLAADGRFKYQDGQGRRLLRLGMAGLLPEKCLSRTSKMPFSPDYHLRYENNKYNLFNILKDFSKVEYLNGVVDFDKATRALESAPAYRVESPMQVDRNSQFTVPYTLYLCYFLRRFGKEPTRAGLFSS
jgi:asparagine synthase (glutamine-hydrolysing)